MGLVDPFKKIKLLEIIGKHIPDAKNKSNSNGSSNQALGSNQRDGVNSGGGVAPEDKPTKTTGVNIENKKNTYKVGEQEIEVSSGHGYYNKHDSGRLADMNISQENIDNAILKDVVNQKNISLESNIKTEFNINVDGIDIQYRAWKDPTTGKIRVNNYYPGKE